MPYSELDVTIPLPDKRPFPKDLQKGSVNEDVRVMQEILNLDSLLNNGHQFMVFAAPELRCCNLSLSLTSTNSVLYTLNGVRQVQHVRSVNILLIIFNLRIILKLLCQYN